MSNRLTTVLVASLGLIAAAGCGAKKTALPHAVYANQIPIYPGAVLKDMMGSTSVGDAPESMSDGMAWFFEVKAPQEKLVAFYEKKLPEARRDPDWTEGVRLVWTPTGAEPGEQLSVVLGENDLSIKESVKPGKRPGNPNADSQGMAQELSGSMGSGDDD